METAIRRPSLWEVSRFWLRIGAVSWGGFYVVLPRIQAEVIAKGWAKNEDFEALIAAATLVPGPSFISLSGLIGYKVRGIWGSLFAMLSLMLPPTVLVAGALILMSEGINSGPTAEIVRTMSIAMSGVILASAWRIARTASFKVTGLLLLLAVFAAILAGISVFWTTVVAVGLSRWLLGGKAK